MLTYLIFWAPEGRAVARVTTKDAAAAKRLTPQPYRKFMGEVYVMLESEYVEQYGTSPRIW